MAQMKDDLIGYISRLSKECVCRKIALLDAMRRNDALSCELIYQLVSHDVVNKLLLIQEQAERVEAAGHRLLQHEKLLDNWSYGSRNTDLGDGVYAVELTRDDLLMMSRPYLREGIAILKGHLTFLRRLLDEYEDLTQTIAIMDAALYGGII